jgi:hypothetical protein
MATYREYRKALIELINSIEAEIGLDEENGVLLLYLLDSVEKISAFNEWVQSKLVNGKLLVTETEICRAAVQISKRFGEES